jgi:hypothetical protein
MQISSGTPIFAIRKELQTKDSTTTRQSSSTFALPDSVP